MSTENLGIKIASLVTIGTLLGACGGATKAAEKLPTPPAAAPAKPTDRLPTSVPTSAPTVAEPTATVVAPAKEATRPILMNHDVSRLAVGAEGVSSGNLTAEQLGETLNYGEGRTLNASGMGKGSAQLYAEGTSARILDAPNLITVGGQTYKFDGYEANGGLAKYTGGDGKNYVLPTDVDADTFAMTNALYSVGPDGVKIQIWDGNGKAVAPFASGWRELGSGEKIVVDELDNFSMVSPDGKTSWVFDGLTSERKWEAVAVVAATATLAPTEAPTKAVVKEAVQVPESVFPRYGVFKGSLVDGGGKDVGRMVLVRLPGATPADDVYAKLMVAKDPKGETWVGWSVFRLTEINGVYLQTEPPAQKITNLVFENGERAKGEVVRPRGKAGVDVVSFNLTGGGKGKESLFQAARGALNDGLRKDNYSDQYISKLLNDASIPLPK